MRNSVVLFGFVCSEKSRASDWIRFYLCQHKVTSYFIPANYYYCDFCLGSMHASEGITEKRLSCC